MRMIRELGRSIMAITRFWSVIWKWRWYDYSYTVDLIERDLELKLRYWGKHTHYVGAQFTRGRILVLLRALEAYRNAGWTEEPRLWRKFMRRYARTLDRLWD